MNPANSSEQSQSPGSNPAWAFHFPIKGKRETEALLTAAYPLVWRLAHGLCGDSALAAGMTRRLLRRSLDALPKWESDIESQNWFLHHTVLESRHATASSSPWSWAGDANPQALAFMKAFASLPFQQREVFLLCHGENLDPRRIAIAMDCSTTAAGNHLNAATFTLRRLAGEEYDVLLATLIKAYQSPPPPGDLVIANTARAATRRAWRRRILKIFGWILIAAVIVGGWLLYRKFNG
jgi:DNA-directed RNA polymerase specialized sigma24 family protein